jgi:predicted Rossmann fold nucleotide-binding protein DprA/Smf involved in DNA uptake
MNLSQTAQATLLLTSYFSKSQVDTEKPLTNTEWGRFALWLKNKGNTPADLLSGQPRELLEGWHDSKVTIERLLALLGRGHSLALAVEKWQRAGLWTVTRSDAVYPKRLKSRLKTDAPPVLFGCGNKELLNAGGIAVVGSRNACDEDLQFTHALGAKSAFRGICIISGGARGVDESAMLAAMNAGGNVIGVMADSLLKAATASKWRKGLMDGNLVLVSPFYPEAGFNTGNAMARNKYIYCLADAALVVHSGIKGGTINGAEENLKKKWVPLWVKPTKDTSAANSLLVNKGGFWCAENIEQLELSSLTEVTSLNTTKSSEKQNDLFSKTGDQPDIFSDVVREEEPLTLKNTSTESQSVLDIEPEPKSTYTDGDSEGTQRVNEAVDFYQLFLKELLRLTTNPLTVEDIIAQTQLHKSQVAAWLKQATENGHIKKLNHPVRYQRSRDSK